MAIHCVVYSACDISNGKHYVGQTRKGFEHRKAQHLRSGLGDHFHNALRKRRDSFVWRILEEMVFEEEQSAQEWMNDREVYWGTMYKAMVDDGGYGLELGNRQTLSNETLEKMRVSASKRSESETWKKNHEVAIQRVTATEGWREKNRKALAQTMSTQEWKTAQKDGCRRRSDNLEWLWKKTEASRALANDEEWLKKNAEIRADLANDPEFIEKRRAGIERRTKDPEWQQKNAESNRKKVEDPEWRKKVGCKSFKCVETGRVFTTQGQCAKEMGLTQTGISLVLRGKAKQCKGYTFEYVDDSTEMKG